VNDWKAAAEMYMAAGDHSQAITILGKRGWYKELMKVVNDLKPR
jgi:hypothetical protein